VAEGSSQYPPLSEYIQQNPFNLQRVKELYKGKVLKRKSFYSLRTMFKEQAKYLKRRYSTSTTPQNTSLVV